jgi:glycosyltransferase involved in cell wall biosynthesis
MAERVLYLITELSMGGAQQALARLLSGLNRERFSPSIACLYNGDGPAAQAIRNLGIPVTDLRMGHKLDLAALARLQRLIAAARPAILHTSLFHANLPGRIAGRLAGVPVIVSSERTMAMESEWRYRLNRWTIGWVDRVVAVSQKVAEFCIGHIGLPANKVTVIYNGLPVPEESKGCQEEARKALGLPDGTPVLGAVGRLDPAKGFDVLLRAFAIALKTCPGSDTRLTIVGDGPLRRSLQALAGELDVATRTTWTGFRRDVPALLPAFDLFVQPSLFEGLPNSVLEAMAVGLPVAASDAGGIPEVVVDGQTGLLAPAGDPAPLAAAMVRLLGDPALRRQMGQAGRERVRQQFSIQKMVDETQTLYESLIAEKRLGRTRRAGTGRSG